MSSPAETLAMGFANQAMDYKFQSMMADKQNAMYQQNQAKNFDYSQKAQKMAAKNSVEGLIAAGISPAFAGGDMSPASMPSAPQGSAHVNPSAIDPVGAVLAEKQSQVLDAQARLLENQAVGQDIKNENDMSQNATIDLNLRNYLTAQISDPSLDSQTKDFFSSLLANESSFNLGSLQGLDSYFALSNKQREMVDKKFEHEFNIAMNQARLEHDVPEFMASMSQAEYNKLCWETAQIYANILKLSSETSLNSDLAEKYRSEIARNIAEANSITHGDYAQLLNTGDYKSLFATIGGHALEAALAMGANIAVFRGAGLAGNAGKWGTDAAKGFLNKISTKFSSKATSNAVKTGGLSKAATLGPVKFHAKNGETFNIVSQKYGQKYASEMMSKYQSARTKHYRGTFEDFMKQHSKNYKFMRGY